MMKANELVQKALNIANNYKTLYVMGCIGAPLTGGNVSRYCTNHTCNMQAARTAMIKKAGNQSPPVYGFDCVCLIKAILWGWKGDSSKSYGGAVYASNGVPDIGADKMITLCSGVSTDFSKIVPGAVVWLSGHIGIYVGDGLAVECSPAFANCVQITAVSNIGKKAGYNARKWTRWGKLPYVDYSGSAVQSGTGTTKKEEPELTEAQVRAIVRDEYAKIEAERAALPVSDWAKGELSEAQAKGITDGTRPQSFATRQETAIMIGRALGR